MPTRDKRLVARDPTLSAQRKNYELPNYLRHGSSGGTLPRHHLGMPQASGVVGGIFYRGKETIMEYLVVFITMLMIAGYACIIGRSLRGAE